MATREPKAETTAIRAEVIKARETLKNLKGRVAQIDSEIETLRRERLAVLKPPLPLSDVVEWVRKAIDANVATGERQFVKAFTSTIERTARFTRYSTEQPEYINSPEQYESLFGEQLDNPINLLHPLTLVANTDGTTPVHVGVGALIFGELYKQALERLADGVLAEHWPQEVGLPRVERLAKAREITAKITELEAERAELQGLGHEMAQVS